MCLVIPKKTHKQAIFQQDTFFCNVSCKVLEPRMNTGKINKTHKKIKCVLLCLECVLLCLVYVLFVSYKFLKNHINNLYFICL